MHIFDVRHGIDHDAERFDFIMQVVPVPAADALILASVCDATAYGSRVLWSRQLFKDELEIKTVDGMVIEAHGWNPDGHVVTCIDALTGEERKP